MKSLTVADYRSLWFRPDLSASLPDDVRVIDVRPLLRAVLESIALADFHEDWCHGRLAHLLGLCIHEICDAPQEAMLLPFPSYWRLVKLTSHPDRMPPELQVLEEMVGASGKTITRIFQKETGMGYQQWRQQWRLMRAIELLATGQRITQTRRRSWSSRAIVFSSLSFENARRHSQVIPRSLSANLATFHHGASLLAGERIRKRRC